MCKICPLCNSEFTTTKPTKKFCSIPCTRKWHRLQNKNKHLKCAAKYRARKRNGLPLLNSKEKYVYPNRTTKAAEWAKTNPQKRKKIVLAAASARRARVRNAIPSWNDPTLTNKLYEIDGNHVHHIVPLKDVDGVCGLHYHENLISLHPDFHKYIHSNSGLLEQSFLWTTHRFLEEQEKFLSLLN